MLRVILSFVLLAISLPLHAANTKPNIVIILADDMGYSDLGCYGSEIETPNLDKLARSGLRFTQFYNNGRCCPTRASLLTGLFPHQTGIGWMTSSMGKPDEMDQGEFGYRGYLNKNCVTLAEVLRGAGYQTLMTGKWHVGAAKREMWPRQRGFDHFYGIIDGAANYFTPTQPRGLTNENEQLPTPDKDYYLTDDFTDHAVKFIEGATSAEDRPFFLYAAYTCPHWPLHAPEEVVPKYKETYQVGWGKTRQARYRKMLELGIVKPEWKLTPRHARTWKSLNAKQQAEMAHRMAVYAAQIDRMDQNIGRLVETLGKQGKLDNTIIFFLSDNGGCAEGGELGGGEYKLVNTGQGPLLSSYGRAWANVSNTPFRRYKHHTHEGGIATPLIVHWPVGIAARGELRDQPGYLPDFMATCVDLSGATYPTSYDGNDIPPMEGISLAPAFANKPLERDAMYWEHEGNQAIRQGNWKLVKRGDNPNWELYDLAADRTEMNNLAAQDSQRVAAMGEKWEEWAKRTHVLPRPQPRR